MAVFCDEQKTYLKLEDSLRLLVETQKAKAIFTGHLHFKADPVMSLGQDSPLRV